MNVLGLIVDWANNTGNKIADIILGPFINLPGFLKMLVTFALLILTVVGAVTLARKMLKAVVGIACLFIIIMIVWLFIS